MRYFHKILINDDDDCRFLCRFKDGLIMLNKGENIRFEIILFYCERSGYYQRVGEMSKTFI